MKRYINVVNGIKRGVSIEAPDHAQPPADQWTLLGDGETDPDDGSSLVDGEWVAPPPAPPPAAEELQSAWDAKRASAQTKLFQVGVFKALKAQLGARAPAEINQYIAIEQADIPDSIVLED